MLRVLSAEGARALDAYMMNEVAQPGFLLMENAANALLDEVLKRDVSSVLILCGRGNNGGDGIALYRKLSERRIDSSLVFLSDPEALQGDAGLNFDIVKKAGLEFTVVHDSKELEAVFLSKRFSTIVDAIFGTGLSKPVTGLYAEAIALSNSYPAYRIAVDIPSGIEADTGHVLGAAFRADSTVTFQTAKRGHFLLPGREYTGSLTVAPIGLPGKFPYPVEEFLLEECDIASLLPKRPMDSHKGKNGRALLIAGSEDMPGAALMSASSALRSGAGLLKVCTLKSVAQTLNARLPEAMTYALSSWADITPDMLSWADAIAIGPGLGDRDEFIDIIAEVLKTGKPAVIDADAINMLSKSDTLKSMLHNRVVLTPHPGEMHRLSGEPMESILHDPLGAARRFAKEYNTNLLLKGATSLIAECSGRVYYNITGNPGLAKGGSGDVLTGIILAMLAQGLDTPKAAAVGAYILGDAADRAAKDRPERTLIASDVIDSIRV